MLDVDSLLIDHAHCEMKAASNALALATRHPEDARLVRSLTDLAREEIDHFQRVLSILVARGVALGPPPIDEYAARLRRAVNELPRSGARPVALADRLLVGALIEARSCERFQLLADASADRGDLRSLWRDLLACEARHYRTFVDLAVDVMRGDRAAVTARLEQLSRIEATIVADLPHPGASRATIHG